MYGLVNQAIQKLVCERFGEDKWDEIKKKAGIDTTVFCKMDQYPDAVTYHLVEAASDVLEIPPEKILEAFGEYWTLYTADEGYDDFLQMGGSTVPEFLSNLNHLHSRVKLLYDGLNPPLFRISDQNEQSLILHYFSERPGLAPMVKGLLLGLGKRLACELTIERLDPDPSGADNEKKPRYHEKFLITMISGDKKS